MNAVNTLSKQFDRNYFVEDVNSLNFGEDHLDVDDVIKWIYTTQDCIAFCQTTRNDFDFDDEIWFENRALHALGINIVAKKMKEISIATSLSQLYTSWSSKPSYNGHICSFQRA